MNYLIAHNLCESIVHLYHEETRLHQLGEAKQKGGVQITPELTKEILERLNHAESSASSIQLECSLESIKRAKRWLERTDVDKSYSRIHGNIQEIREQILTELSKNLFIHTKSDRKDYADKTDLFGEKVKEAFPSHNVQKDIQEAGNCLAVECNTAAVFHLMRVVEHGLRALARDRGVKNIPSKNKPIELAQWGEIIGEITKEINSLKGNKSLAFAAQTKFYHDILEECGHFKEAWRNHVMHTRDYYDRDAAHSIMVHVGAFMKKLSAKISETKKTPKIWKEV